MIAGIALGYVNVGILMPKVFLVEQVGLINCIMGIAALFAILAKFSLDNMPIKFYPFFKTDDKKHNGFLTLIIIILVLAVTLTTVVSIVFKTPITNFFISNSPLIVKHYYLAIPLMISMAALGAIYSFARAISKSVVPTFCIQILNRLCIFVLIILFVYQLINFSSFLLIYVLVPLVGLTGIITYLIYLKQFNFSPKVNFEAAGIKLKKILDFNAFKLLGNTSTVLVQHIDKLMIASIMGLSNAGVYSIAYIFASVVSLPVKAQGVVVAPQLSMGLKNNDLPKVAYLYKKVANINLIVGSIMYILLLVNFKDLFSFLPAEYLDGFWVIAIIGFGALLNLATGMNANILVFSKYYKYDLYTYVLLIITTITTNLILIPILGIEGAALASLISVFSHNTIRTYLVWRFFRILPFQKSNLLVICIALCIAIGAYFLPSINNAILNILVKSTIILFSYGSLILLSKASPEMNQFFNKLMKKVL